MSQVQLTEDLLSQRNLEVSAYLDFLKIAVERRAMLSAKDGELRLPLSMELTHTLKANLILLLYSAMEATLVQLLDEMHDAIGANCSSADALNAQLLRAVLKAVRKSSSSGVLSASSPLHTSLFQYWMDDWKSRTTSKEKRSDGISGSVDSLVFYEQLKNFGVVAQTPNDRPPEHLTNAALQKIRVNRNQLAHGEKSFIDLGRDLAVSALESDSFAVFGTLQRITAEVDSYLQEQRYLAHPSTATAPAAARTEA